MLPVSGKPMSKVTGGAASTMPPMPDYAMAGALNSEASFTT